MTSRMKATIVLLLYLFFNSVLIGALFSKKHILVGIISGMIAQCCAAYLLILIARTEP